MKKVFLFLILFAGYLGAFAQDTISVKRNFFESLSVPDSVHGAVVVVIQDPKIEKLMLDQPGNKITTVSSGYRVQVFSSNVQRTAKNQAYKIEHELHEAFPMHTVYVSYSAPFWKVRIGDFRSQAEAQELRSEIISVFSSLRSETYIVRDNVNL